MTVHPFLTENEYSLTLNLIQREYYQDSPFTIKKQLCAPV
jgi:hypothetical protein